MTLSLLAVVALVLPPTTGAAGAASDVGYRDFSYGSGTTAPTADKPQSKLWFHAGSWWGSLFSSSAKAFTIHRLDKATQQWSDTRVLVDDRANAKVDALWDGTHLTVAAAGPSSTSSADSIRVTRYAFENGQYAAQPGYPVTVVSGGSESVVIDRDSTGVLWMTWTRSNKVYVSHSTTGDASWVPPYVLPVDGAADLSADDISAVVAFGSSIGVLWGNQNDRSRSGNSYWFAVHRDGTDDTSTSWTRELAYGGVSSIENADDHLNVKSLQSDSEGRIFASVKTSLNGGEDPLIVLLVRGPSGTWDRDNVLGRGADNHTRAIVLLDDTNDVAHAFAASPCCSGGVIYHKKASFTALANGNPFASGLGAPFIRSSTDTTINNPTSTKQTLDGSTGLVVLAADDSTRHYLHGFMELADPSSVVPDTTIDSGPSGDVGSTTASFAFSSDNSAATFECSLDGSPMTACTSPTTYPDLGLGGHSFAVRAVTPAGADPSPATASWNVVQTLPVTVAATADGMVQKASPDTSYGSSTTLSADTSPTTESYLRFHVTGVSGRPVTRAVLRLFVTNGSTNGPAVHRTTDTSWGEGTLTWNTKPAYAGPALANAAAVGKGAWVEYDVSAAVTGDGPHGFALVPDSSDGLDAASRESATQQPQLVVTMASDTTAPATSITSGPAGTVDTGNAEIAFTSSEPGSFECSLDTSPYGACTSPVTYTNLANGTHSFAVRATDTAGNTDASPATLTWTVQRTDSTAPETTITSAPSGTISSADADIEFVSDEPSTFECRLDGAAYAACESPINYDFLPDGQHLFEVRATDPAGNVDDSPASATWTTQTGILLEDGFESGDLSAWTAVRTGGDGAAGVQGDVVHDGAFAARLSASANTGSSSYARRTLETGVQELTAAQDVQVAAEGASGGNVPLVRLFDDQGVRVLSVYRQNLGKDKVYVSYGGSYYLTKALLPLGTWARVEVHVRLAGSGTSVVEVTVNGQVVHSSTTATVASSLRTVQLGNETTRQAFVLYADNVRVSRPVG